MAETEPVAETALQEVDAPSADALLDEAIALWMADDTEGALARVEQALTLAPDHTGALGLRGEIYFYQGNVTEARADLERASQSPKANFPTLITLAEVLDALGEHDQAIAVVDRMLEILKANRDEDLEDNPGLLGIAYRGRGYANRQLGNLVAAEEDYGRAIDIGLSLDQQLATELLPGAYMGRADVRTSMGNLSGAIADTEAALQWNPWNYAMYDSLRALRHALVRTEAAFEQDPDILLAQYDAALAENPTDEKALFGRGTVYLTRAQLQGNLLDLTAAMADFSAAIESDPQHAQAYHRRGLARMASAGSTAAMSDLLANAELAASGANINLHGDGYTISASNNTVTITYQATGEITVQPLDEWVENIEAIVLEAEEMHELARADLAQAVELDPEQAAAVHDLAVFDFMLWGPEVAGALLGLGGIDPALRPLMGETMARFDQAVALDPTWQQARFNRALANLFWAVVQGREGTDVGSTSMVAYSPDGSLLVGATGTGDLLIWDAATGEEVAATSQIRMMPSLSAVARSCPSRLNEAD